MARTPGSPSLDYFLEQTRGHNGPCIYVRKTTPEQRAAIREKVEEGHHRWEAFARWLASEGTPDVLSAHVQYHFIRHPDDER